MMTEQLEKHSCLLEDQSGIGVSEVAKPLSAEEAIAANVKLDTMAMEAWEAVSGIASPPVYRTYQGRAATRRNRTKADIDTVVLHTPEGGEAGTLSVLNGVGAGFDFFLPPSGRLYKTNDFYRYIAWQAGDWPTNQRSIGIEQWDFASQMHLAPRSHYERLARLCAYLVEVLNLAIRASAGYGHYGFIYHRMVTPGARCDPDNCGKSRFDMELFLDLVLDYKRGVAKPPGPKPPPKPEQKLYRVYLSGEDPQVFASHNLASAREVVMDFRERYGVEAKIR